MTAEITIAIAPGWRRFMPEGRKSYLGFVEHDEPSFKPPAFVNVLAGYLGWDILQALNVVEFVPGRDVATVRLTRAYGHGSVELLMAASDCGAYSSPGGSPVQRVALNVSFDDPGDWHDPASEALVAGTMRALDDAILKLTTYERIWQRTTGYWRCGAALYQCPDAPDAEPQVVPPPQSLARIGGEAVHVTDPTIAITEHDAVEGGVLGMRWQSTLRVVNGMGRDYCVKLMIHDQHDIPVPARAGSSFADYHGNLSILSQLDQPRYSDTTYTVNFFLPYDAFAPMPGQTRLYRGRAIVLQGQRSQAELAFVSQSVPVEFYKTDA
jgi:hypothetical protein